MPKYAISSPRELPQGIASKHMRAQDNRRDGLAKELASTKIIDSGFANRCHYAFRTNSKLCLILDYLDGQYLGWDWPKNKKMDEE